MIPDDHKDLIISSGIEFMRSITRAYGAEEGMKLWETIANTLDPEIKGQIFFAMLTGEQDGAIHVYGFHPAGDRIGMIKAIRKVSNLGLKEAKDLCDQLWLDGKSIRVPCTSGQRTLAMSVLRDAGLSC